MVQVNFFPTTIFNLNFPIFLIPIGMLVIRRDLRQFYAFIFVKTHAIKYARIWVFTDPYLPAEEQIEIRLGLLVSSNYNMSKKNI